MPFSFHSHSGEFCHHAKGKLEDMIISAIQQGYQSFGLSEHVPRFNQIDLYPEENHLTPNDLKLIFFKYLKEAHRLKLKYQNQIEILIGAESEYLGKEYLEQLNNVLDFNKIDYIIGSIHHVDNIPIDFDQKTFNQVLCKYNNNYEKLFNAYFEQQYKLLKFINPLIIGHFDLIRLFATKNYHHTFPNSTYQLIERNIKYIISYGGIFEINSSGFKKKLPSSYPLKDVLLMIIKFGGKLTLSDDSHAPEQVGQFYNETKLYLKDVGVTSLVCLSKSNSIKPADYEINRNFYEVKGLEIIEFKDWDKLPFWYKK